MRNAQPTVSPSLPPVRRTHIAKFQLKFQQLKPDLRSAISLHPTPMNTIHNSFIIMFSDECEAVNSFVVNGYVHHAH
jgi:hypothetical protein